MFDPERHEPLAEFAWNETDARAAIAEIAGSAISSFDEEKLWPAHPLDSIPDGTANVYMGACGVILALDYLTRAGAIDHARDFGSRMPGIVTRDNVWLGNTPMGAYGSLLFGDLGNRLVQFRLAPSSETAEAIHARAADNDRLPPLELMWGMPGSMLACLFMHSKTGEQQFETLYCWQAERLWHDLGSGAPRLWTQDLYGKRARFLGLVHGFSGNMIALLRGWNSHSEARKKAIADIALQALFATARVTDTAANWPVDADRTDVPMLCQICHGAPGVLAAFAGAPFASDELDSLLAKAGEHVWSAGPLKKGSNFCHGTGGNAYALLKLFRRTGDERWLGRARSFAMHAIAQLRAATQEYGRGRYSLWTGDPGLAICLWNCITGEPDFPLLDSL